MGGLFRLITAITQIIEVYTFGGLIFGFNTLIYIFKKEGIYAHLCDQAIYEDDNLVNSTDSSLTDSSCTRQDLIFAQQYSAGVCSFYVTVIVAGVLLDLYGLFRIRLAFFVQTFIGAICLALTVYSNKLLWLAVVAMGSQAALAILVAFPIANLYPAQKGIFLTVIGGFFDSSSTVLMIYQLIFDGGIARLFWISMTYAGLSCFLMVRTLFMVPIHTIPAEADDEYSVIEHTWWAGVCGRTVTSEQRQKVNENTSSSTFAGSLLQLGKLSYLWTGCFFYLMASFRQNMLVAVYNSWTRYIENTIEMESYLTLMFGVIGYAEIAFSILPGALIDLFARYTDRQWGILSCQTIAAILCGVLSVLMGLRSQLAAVIAITCYYMFRTFTFGSLSVFAAVCFPPEFFGTINGILTITMMPTSFIAPQMFSYMIKHDKSFDWLATVCVVCSITMLIHPITVAVYLLRKRRRIDPDNHQAATELETHKH